MVYAFLNNKISRQISLMNNDYGYGDEKKIVQENSSIVELQMIRYR